MKKFTSAFTLVELLVVISILGVLATVTLAAFRSSQARGRDTERKSDLKQIASALELYYSDYGKYPPANASGQIEGCPSTSGTPCNWGSGQFTDTKTTYFRVIPKDPVAGQNYYYRTLSSDQKFQLYAYLENTKDINLMPDVVAKNYPCGGSRVCNFSVTSPNTTPTE